MNVRQILDVVCAHHGMSPELALCGMRTSLRTTVRAQTIALAREFTCGSWRDIAESMELGDNSSAASLFRNHKARMRDAASPYVRSFKAIQNSLKQRIEQ